MEQLIVWNWAVTNMGSNNDMKIKSYKFRFSFNYGFLSLCFNESGKWRKQKKLFWWVSKWEEQTLRHFPNVVIWLNSFVIVYMQIYIIFICLPIRAHTYTQNRLEMRKRWKSLFLFWKTFKHVIRIVIRYDSVYVCAHSTIIGYYCVCVWEIETEGEIYSSHIENIQSLYTVLEYLKFVEFSPRQFSNISATPQAQPFSIFFSFVRFFRHIFFTFTWIWISYQLNNKTQQTTATSKRNRAWNRSFGQFARRKKTKNFKREKKTFRFENLYTFFPHTTETHLSNLCGICRRN